MIAWASDNFRLRTVERKMTGRVSYEADVCARLRQAGSVPCRQISLPDGAALPSECHRRVNTWLLACPGQIAVRGWVVQHPFPGGVRLTAHSVVRDERGELYDVTLPPPKPGETRAWQKFVPHIGDDESFDRFRQNAGVFLDCKHC